MRELRVVGWMLGTMMLALPGLLFATSAPNPVVAFVILAVGYSLSYLCFAASMFIPREVSALRKAFKGCGMCTSITLHSGTLKFEFNEKSRVCGKAGEYCVPCSMDILKAARAI